MSETPSGGLRSDIRLGNFVPGEDRTVRVHVYDVDGVSVTSFSGWTFAFYLLPSLDTVLASALATYTLGAGITSPAVAPNVDATIPFAMTNTLHRRLYAYECWRTDVGNRQRLAYGTIAFED